MQEWLGKVVDREDLTRHDKWLCMMMPQLKLLRELLREDGVIFVSIDENEVHHLRMLMDELFGEDNFIAELVVIRAEGGGLAKQVIKGHDYLLVYARQIARFEPLKRPKDIRGKIIEKEGVRYWLEEDWLRKEFGKYGTCHYEEIEKYKGINKKQEIDDEIKKGIYQLIQKNNSNHIVARLRNIEKDGTKFYSILKHLSASGVHDLETLT
jgi:adenine-specific DNA-methyltransferase